jgi:SAM-dependent methyltransferase
MNKRSRHVSLNDVRGHYANLLAEHYDWMFAVPVETKVAEQRRFFERHVGGVEPDALAIDLGCGSGFQSLALADLGYTVLSIDTSERLLRALKERSGSRRIRTVHADLLGIESFGGPASAELVICMGDTITHLPSRDSVRELVRSVSRILKPDGRFVVTYRDLAASEPQGLDRFVAVHGDDRRVMTCFLEYVSADIVVVNDLIHVRDAGGKWILKKSCYEKLRLPVEWLCNELLAADLSATILETRPMTAILATKQKA